MLYADTSCPQYTALTTMCVAFSSTCMSLLTESNDEGAVQLFCTQTNCVFGWAHPDWLAMMLCFGLTIGVICIAGFNYAVEFISPIVFSSVTLVDPAVTGLIAWLAGLEALPDMLTIMGGIVVVGGVVLISAGERKRAAAHSSEEGSEHDTELSSVPTEEGKVGHGVQMVVLNEVQQTSMMTKIFAVSNVEPTHGYVKVDAEESKLDVEEGYPGAVSVSGN
jgi:hypothetical protein